MRLISFLKEKLILIISKIKLIFTKKTTTNIDPISFENTLDNNIDLDLNEHESRTSSARSSIIRSPRLHDSSTQHSLPASPTSPIKTLTDPSNRSNPIFLSPTNIHSTFGAGSFDHNLHSVDDVYNLIIHKLQRYMKRSNLHQLSLTTITEQLQHMNLDLHELTTEDLIEFKNKCLTSNKTLTCISHPLAYTIEDFLLCSDETYAVNRYKYINQELQAKWENINESDPKRITLNSREIHLIFEHAYMDLNYLSLTSLRILQSLWVNDTTAVYYKFVKLILEQKISMIIREKINSMSTSSATEQTKRSRIEETGQQVNLEDTNANNNIEAKSNQVKCKLY